MEYGISVYTWSKYDSTTQLLHRYKTMSLKLLLEEHMLIFFEGLELSSNNNNYFIIIIVFGVGFIGSNIN